MSNWVVLDSRFAGDTMDRNWPTKGGVVSEAEVMVKGLGAELGGWGGGEGDSRLMERVRESRVEGWSRRARREVWVAWRRSGAVVVCVVMRRAKA